MARVYRYSYIIDGSGSVHGKVYKVTVHSLFFHWRKYPESELIGIAQNEAERVYNLVIPDWFTREIGEEFEEVTYSETKKLGIYILGVHLNDELVKTVHLRHRQRGQTIFDNVSIAVRRVVRWLSNL